MADPVVTARVRPSDTADVTLEVDDVEVTYRVFEDRQPSLRQVVASGFRRRQYRDVHAVRGVSLTARAGESIGVIGRNGSGKSTLLRAMAGLIPPTSGRVRARSAPTLLGVGAALNPSLSGRRNIMLGGLAIGLSRRGVDEVTDEVIDFAGVRDFIDMPMRTYSSGMKARLQFAIASSVRPEVLLVDETLAVGDQDFRERSRERVRSLTAHAGTVVIVSHSMSVVRDMCTRALWLASGKLIEDGDPVEVIAAYKAGFKNRRRG